jgi:F420-dependent methylenetetrahydromethanopterin dehydrogenase
VTGTQSVTFTSTAPTGASFADDFALTVDWNTSSPTDTKYRIGILLHKDAMVLAEAQKVRTQQQYKQEYLGYLVTSDCIFGTAELRDYGGLCVAVPA